MDSEKKAADIVIRAMKPDDLPEVTIIDREASPLPWSGDIFANELNSSLARNLVAESEGRIIGYLCFWIVAGEVQIQNIAVRRDWRGCGVASRLLAGLREIAGGEQADTATLEVRSRNESAIRLYVKNGFVVKGIRRKYYDDDGDDALIMGADL
jgi:ribosomal-protein-alanine N-acetyltransferase